MVSIVEMVVNQYVFRFFLKSFGLFGIEEKVLGNPPCTQAFRPDINAERRCPKRFTEQLFVPKDRNILKNMLLELVIDVIIIAIAAQAHHNSIYIFDKKIITKKYFVNCVL